MHASLLLDVVTLLYACFFPIVAFLGISAYECQYINNVKGYMKFPVYRVALHAHWMYCVAAPGKDRWNIRKRSLSEDGLVPNHKVPKTNGALWWLIAWV